MFKEPGPAFGEGVGPRSSAQTFAGVLQEFYRDLLQQGVPDHLAALVRRLDHEAPRPEGHPKLALVVDPDRESRAHATLLLEQTGLVVVECASAETALARLEEHGADVAFIFADETLAGEPDGCELAQAASTRPGLRMILTTETLGSRPDCLPSNVITMRKPWRGLDLMIEAERALADAGGVSAAA